MTIHSLDVLLFLFGTRRFRYDLNQIPYDYPVEVRNRFKGLDLKDRVPDDLWTEVRDIVQETGIKTIPMERNAKKQKLESRLAGEISITSDMQMTPPLWQKGKRNSKAS